MLIKQRFLEHFEKEISKKLNKTRWKLKEESVMNQPEDKKLTGSLYGYINIVLP